MALKSLFPFLLLLAAGMGVGSIHNAQARGGIPGITTPFGFVLIALTFLVFLCAVYLLRHYDGLRCTSRRVAIGAATCALVIEGINLVTTLASEGSLSGWLFHEYLGVVAAVGVFVQVLILRADPSTR